MIEAHLPPVHHRESLWPARLAVLAIIGLQLLLNERLTAGPNWLLPGLELLLLLPLTALRSAQRRSLYRYGRLVLRGGRKLPSHGVARLFAFLLVGLINLANLFALLMLARSLLHGGNKASGEGLLIDALDMWITNATSYALAYWELDRGGPLRRGSGREGRSDFLFPPMTVPELAPHWRPAFVDYLFVSFTNATAFSPTDTLPLTGRVKWLMMAQAATSLVTIALIASRAVNILA